MSSRRTTLAHDLLALLAEHISVCESWEDHYTSIAEGTYENGEEKENNRWLRQNKTMPFLQQLEQSEFKYSEIIEIIPPAFETTTKQRISMYKDLVCWADEVYDDKKN